MRHRIYSEINFHLLNGDHMLRSNGCWEIFWQIQRKFEEYFGRVRKKHLRSNLEYNLKSKLYWNLYNKLNNQLYALGGGFDEVNRIIETLRKFRDEA